MPRVCHPTSILLPFALRVRSHARPSLLLSTACSHPKQGPLFLQRSSPSGPRGGATQRRSQLVPSLRMRSHPRPRQLGDSQPVSGALSAPATLPSPRRFTLSRAALGSTRMHGRRLSLAEVTQLSCLLYLDAADADLAIPPLAAIALGYPSGAGTNLILAIGIPSTDGNHTVGLVKLNRWERERLSQLYQKHHHQSPPILKLAAHLVQLHSLMRFPLSRLPHSCPLC